MCIHNEEDIDCDDCCYDCGFQDAKHEDPYDPEYKNCSQVNSYRDGYRSYFKNSYWCCTQDFNEHDIWCVNYKESKE
jgi:hypothetical protein